MSHTTESNHPMKHILTTLTVLCILQAATAQERLATEEALRYAKLAGADTQQLQGTPIPTSVDLNRPVALRDGDYGGMVLPEAKLTAESLAQATDKVVPVGQLWLLRLTVMREGEAVSGDRLRLATVKTGDGGEVKVVQCALGVRRNSAGSLELLIYGKDKEPLLSAPLKAIQAQQELPLDMEAEREGDFARVTLRILGRHEARFRVTAWEP